MRKNTYKRKLRKSLTAEQEIEIIVLYKKGIKIKYIAEDLKIGKATVYRVLKRRNVYLKTKRNAVIATIDTPKDINLVVV